MLSGESVVAEGTATAATAALRPQQELSHQEASQESMKYVDQHDQVITIEAVPIVSVEIDGPLDTATPYDSIASHTDLSSRADLTATSTSFYPLSIETTTNESNTAGVSLDFSPKRSTASDAVKIMKRRNFLLAAIAMLLLIALGVGIGIYITTTNNNMNLQSNNAGETINVPDREIQEPVPCNDPLVLMNTCLSENSVNNTQAVCRRCVLDTVPLLNSYPNNYCQAPFFNSTEICLHLQECVTVQACAAPCLIHMEDYIQCLLDGEAADPDSAEDDLLDDALLVAANIAACQLPCRSNVTLPELSIAPTTQPLFP